LERAAVGGSITIAILEQNFYGVNHLFVEVGKIAGSEGRIGIVGTTFAFAILEVDVVALNVIDLSAGVDVPIF
jgi:hypothetical protein